MSFQSIESIGGREEGRRMRCAIGSDRMMVGIPKDLFDDMADIICAACHDRQEVVEGGRGKERLCPCVQETKIGTNFGVH